MLSNLWRELNDFLSSTSVHGLPQIHRSQSGTTRVIWTVLVAGALITATVLLVQTVGDWDTKYISTTLETRGIENYPFPAVTFHPGDFPTKNLLLRTLLNHFEMTRYEQSSPLYENSVFMKKYWKFVHNFGPGSLSLFEWVSGRVLTLIAHEPSRQCALIGCLDIYSLHIKMKTLFTIDVSGNRPPLLMLTQHLLPLTETVHS